MTEIIQIIHRVMNVVSVRISKSSRGKLKLNILLLTTRPHNSMNIFSWGNYDRKLAKHLHRR